MSNFSEYSIAPLPFLIRVLAGKTIQEYGKRRARAAGVKAWNQ
jgi:hypothetical protein